jgi:hypothetical protein
MRMSLTKLENIALTTITTPPLPSLLCLLFLVRPGGYTVIFLYLLFLQDHRETDHFFPSSGVQLAQSTSDQFLFKRVVFSSQLRSKVGNILVKVAALRITLNVDTTPVSSRSHTHPSHSQTARLLTSSMSLGITVPHVT